MGSHDNGVIFTMDQTEKCWAIVRIIIGMIIIKNKCDFPSFFPVHCTFGNLIRRSVCIQLIYFAWNFLSFVTHILNQMDAKSSQLRKKCTEHESIRGVCVCVCHYLHLSCWVISISRKLTARVAKQHSHQCWEALSASHPLPIGDPLMH